jgi:hypothetical protein
MKVNKVWAVPGSLATTTGIVVYFLFLWVLRCFSSPAYRYIAYEFSYTPHDITRAGFPHSDIHGSKLVRQLPVAFRSHLRPSSVSLRQGILCVRLSNFLRTRFCAVSACAGQSPPQSATCGESLRRRLRYSLEVLKYISVCCSPAPCASSARKTVYHFY